MQSVARHPDAAPRWAREDGFTIVEIMAAIVVFTIGVLGTLSLIESSYSSTSRTTAREQGTNLARDLVERTRQATYAETDTSRSASTLRDLLPASDSAGALAGSTFTVSRRNVTYTVRVTSCSIDDPTDGAGVGGTGGTVFCTDTDTSSTGGGSPTPPEPAINVTSVLGRPVTVSAGGSLVETVCNAVALNSVLGTQLQSRVSGVAPISACPGASGTTVAFDRQPDDLRYVRVDVTWTRGGKPGAVTQTTLLANPRQT